ncbi:MAG: bacteriohemerythrin [Rhodospirillales bacterium]|jgi:hemerythrin-like metal-binding protein|nr:bacteriohemerythrin [Rhodospirillales bacterium]MDP6774722.1 bacteriohemerythrin [Rhodospirillales bacterium]
MTGAAADRGIIWSDDFLIGIEELDYEHRRLIENINELHRELLAHVDMDRVEDTLGGIHARMQAHFALEEHVMVSHEYPHYPEHKAEHERLLDEYTELMTKFERAPNLGDRVAMEDILRQWIVDHILTSDKKMSLMVVSSKKNIATIEPSTLGRRFRKLMPGKGPG